MLQCFSKNNWSRCQDWKLVLIKCQIVLWWWWWWSQDSEQKDYINVKGCVPQFEKWLQDNLTLVAGIFIGVALLQVSLHVFTVRMIISYILLLKNVKFLHSVLFSPPQIFGICLAQNLVSDIEAVQASWWGNDLHSNIFSSVSCVSSYRRKCFSTFETHSPWFAPICFCCFHFTTWGISALCHSKKKCWKCLSGPWCRYIMPIWKKKQSVPIKFILYIKKVDVSNWV